MNKFILYSRNYCHLCDDMLEALQGYSSDYAFTVEVIDVDTDEELLALYDELVPVLIGCKPDGTEKRICNYVLDHAELEAFLA